MASGGLATGDACALRVRVKSGAQEERGRERERREPGEVRAHGEQRGRGEKKEER